MYIGVPSIERAKKKIITNSSAWPHELIIQNHWQAGDVVYVVICLKIRLPGSRLCISTVRSPKIHTC